MKDREIFERTNPPQTTLLGLRLLPFSLGHLVLLHHVESSFVTGKDPSYDDLAISVFICSRSYEDSLAAFSDPTLPRAMEQWAKRLTGTGFIRNKIFRRPVRPIDLAAKWREFAAYLERNYLVFQEGKDYVRNGEPGRKVNVPFVHKVRVELQREMHFSDTEIFNRPWSLCILDYFILLDANSALALTDEDALHNALAEAQAVADKVGAIWKARMVNGR